MLGRWVAEMSKRLSSDRPSSSQRLRPRACAGRGSARSMVGAAAAGVAKAITSCGEIDALSTD